MASSTSGPGDSQGYYIIAALDQIEPGSLDVYGPAAAESIVKHGGTVDAILDVDEHFEGDAKTARMVVIRFVDRAAALEWYRSTEYSSLIPLRHAGSITRFMAGYRNA